VVPEVVKKRMKALTVALAAAVTLTGCGPSAEQARCDEQGGVWVTYIVTFIPMIVGKTTVSQPVYSAECRYPAPTEAR
jgi:uncharacterized membrane protein HdeD (DUF308 family)